MGQVVLMGSLLQVLMGLPFQNLSLPRDKMNHFGNVGIASGVCPSHSHSIYENCSFVPNLATSVNEKYNLPFIFRKGAY